MKKCSYCGKEYPDEIANCLADGEPLPARESETPAFPAPVDPSISVSTNVVEQTPEFANSLWTEKQLLIIEVLLVCSIAFGVNVLSSFRALQVHSSIGSGSSAYSWAYTVFRHVAMLGLVWYLLIRRGKSFSDLGLTWSRSAKEIAKVIGISILLRIGGNLAYSGIYDALYYSGLTEVSHKEAGAFVHHYLFGGGIFWSTRLYQFVNPFFEEIIVRGYLMIQVRLLTNSATKAVIISTTLQTSYHFYQGAPVALAHAGTFLLWSIYYAKTNRLTPVVLAHLYSDVGSIFFSSYK
jgi:membrane protease YdiL (CAAX protease family)